MPKLVGPRNIKIPIASDTSAEVLDALDETLTRFANHTHQDIDSAPLSGTGGGAESQNLLYQVVRVFSADPLVRAGQAEVNWGPRNEDTGRFTGTITFERLDFSLAAHNIAFYLTPFNADPSIVGIRQRIYLDYYFQMPSMPQQAVTTVVVQSNNTFQVTDPTMDPTFEMLIT